MELSGKVFKVLPVESGEGKNGPWKKQQVVIELDSNGKYPKKVAVTFWTDLVDNAGFVIGNNISIEFDIESREYNERWYTDVKAWRINKADGGNTSNNNTSTNYQQSAPAPKVEDAPATQVDDDLPF